MKTRIVVPSRERGAWLSKHIHRTLDFMPPSSTIFMVRSDDSQLAAYERYAAAHGMKVTVYDGKDIFYASQTYDYIINQALLDGVDRLAIIDDDLCIKRPNPIMFAKPDFKFCDTDETEELINHSFDIVRSELPMVSYTPINKRAQDRIITFCKPMMMAYVYYMPHFAAHPEHRFWKGEAIEARCDLNLTLRLLTDGYLTGYMNTMTLGDNVANPGGCATYRDLEFEQRSVAALAELYPAFVSTYMRTGWAGDPDQKRLAPKTKWRESFNSVKFKQHFGREAVEFANELVAEYEAKYAKSVLARRPSPK